MPTGYTQDIYYGKNISFRNFMLKCSRAFGACVMLRDSAIDDDNPVPDDVRPVSNYHLERLEEVTKELFEVKNWTAGAATRLANEYNEDRLKDYEESVAKNKTMAKRYQDMIDRVKKWTAPSDEHKDFKDFVIKQLTESLQFDCHIPELPKVLTGEEYRQQKIKSLEWNVNYHTKGYREEVAASAQANAWIKQLKDSLPKE